MLFICVNMHTVLITLVVLLEVVFTLTASNFLTMYLDTTGQKQFETFILFYINNEE